jgi:hypothetical protein
MFEFLSSRQIPCRFQKYKKSSDGKNGLNFVYCDENLIFEQIRILHEGFISLPILIRKSFGNVPRWYCYSS